MLHHKFVEDVLESIEDFIENLVETEEFTAIAEITSTVGPGVVALLIILSIIREVIVTESGFSGGLSKGFRLSIRLLFVTFLIVIIISSLPNLADWLS